MAFEKQKSEKNLKAKYLRMWKFKILFLKVEFDFDLLSLLCKFDENLSTKVALVTNGLTKMYCTVYTVLDSGHLYSYWYILTVLNSLIRYMIQYWNTGPTRKTNLSIFSFVFSQQLWISFRLRHCRIYFTLYCMYTVQCTVLVKYREKPQ